MPEQLLNTKFQLPPLPAQVVLRTRVFELLDRSLHPNLRLTLLSAPAGYGKTTALLSWLAQRALPAAWLSLDENDNDPARFLKYLLAAYQAAFPGLELPSLATGDFPDLELQDNLLNPLINELGRTAQQKLLVLDDYHQLQSEAIHRQVGYLLDFLPAQAHVIIATRADPPLALTRLRGRGQLNELRMTELRFQGQEARAFLEKAVGAGLEPEALAEIARRTEGWISGLQMAACSFRDSRDPAGFLQHFSGTDRYIMDYLLDEVLRRQPEELQRFLLDTSILRRMCGPLCDSLFTDEGRRSRSGRELLLTLERANLFIAALDANREWYRYHQLFADLLQARLAAKSPQRIPLLHRRASAWYEGEGLTEEAIQHALQSQDSAYAADLIERTAQSMLMRSETSTLLRWIQQLPEHELHQRPRLAIYRAWVLLFIGAPFSSFEDQLGEGINHDDPPGSAMTLLAFITLFQGHIERGLEYARQALRLLPPEEIFLREFTSYCAAAAQIGLGQLDSALQQLEQSRIESQHSGNQAAAILILCEIAEQRMKQLKLSDAEELYRRALDLGRSESGKLLPIAGQALIGLGDIALERYDLELCDEHLREGIGLSERWSLIGTIKGYYTMVLLQDAQGEDLLLQQSLATLKELARRFDITEFDDLIVELLEQIIHLHHGELESVRSWIAALQEARADTRSDLTHEQQSLMSRLYRYQLPVLVRMSIADGDFQQALDKLAELIRLSYEPDRPFLRIEAGILQALALHSLKQEEPALEALHGALQLAQPAGVIRPFLVEGPIIPDLLDTGRGRWNEPDLSRFAYEILKKSGSSRMTSRAARSSLPEPLSPRELEVLSYLPSGMTMADLADELVVSVNTVRSHIKSIYAKLGVHNRQQAVQRASELELLP